MTEREEKLVDILIDIWDHADFADGVLSCVETPEDCEMILAFIENESKDPGDIAAFATTLDCLRDENGELIVGDDGFYIQKG